MLPDLFSLQATSLNSESLKYGSGFDREGLELIIEGCKRKEKKFQELLYKRFFGYTLGIARIYLNSEDDAREAVNDSFMKVFTEIQKFDSSFTFKGWLRKIVINTCIDKYRRNSKHKYALETDGTLKEDDNFCVVSSITAEEIIKLLNRLPDSQKIVFNLYEIEGYNHDEIALALNIPVSSSRVYLTRAKKKLRELFPKYFQTNYENTGTGL